MDQLKWWWEVKVFSCRTRTAFTYTSRTCSSDRSAVHVARIIFSRQIFDRVAAVVRSGFGWKRLLQLLRGFHLLFSTSLSVVRLLLRSRPTKYIRGLLISLRDPSRDNKKNRSPPYLFPLLPVVLPGSSRSRPPPLALTPLPPTAPLLPLTLSRRAGAEVGPERSSLHALRVARSAAPPVCGTAVRKGPGGRCLPARHGAAQWIPAAGCRRRCPLAPRRCLLTSIRVASTKP